MKASTGNQTPVIVLGIVGNNLVDFGTEADDFGSNVVDQGGAIDATVVEVIEERPRRAAILLDVVQIGAVALDQFEFTPGVFADVGLAQQLVDGAEDKCERGAELMADAGEKRRFGLIELG